MSVSRGDIVLADMPFPSGQTAKLRPVLVIQSDHNNRRLGNTIVAAITSNTSRAEHEAAQFLIKRNTPEGLASGLKFDSAVVCEYLATIDQKQVGPRVGRLPPETMQRINQCLKTSLGMAS